MTHDNVSDARMLSERRERLTAAENAGDPEPICAAMAEVQRRFERSRSRGLSDSQVATPDEALTGRFGNGAIQSYWNEIAQTASETAPYDDRAKVLPADAEQPADHGRTLWTSIDQSISCQSPVDDDGRVLNALFTVLRSSRSLD